MRFQKHFRETFSIILIYSTIMVTTQLVNYSEIKLESLALTDLINPFHSVQISIGLIFYINFT